MNERIFHRWRNTLLLIGVIGCITFFVSLNFIFPPDDDDDWWRYPSIVVGLSSNIVAIDPIDTMDMPSLNAEYQVVEGLVDYNYSAHPNYYIIPILATEWYWHNSSCISFKIREGIFFHDDTTLDAEAVKWNFDRLMYFINWTGDLMKNETSWEASTRDLYYFSDGTTPIINRTKAISTFNFTVWLNRPFASFLDLLTFSGTYICSPASTPRYTYLDLASDILVGTGPFKWVSFISEVAIQYERNEGYWGKKSWAYDLTFAIIEDDNLRMLAGLAGDIDYVDGVTKEFIDIFKEDLDLHVEEVGDDLCYFYLEFYCGPGDPKLGNPWNYQVLNSTWRRALSLAINYTQIWEDIQDGLVYPGFPAVPRSIPGYNSSLEGKMAHNFPFGGTYADNIQKARELMQSMDYGITWDTNYPGLNEINWTEANFRIIKANEYFGNFTHQELNELLEKSWDLIGVNISITIRTWAEYLNTSGLTPWEMEISYKNWGLDCLDAYNILDPLFNNESIYCYSQISDPLLKNALKTAAEITDLNTRQNIYKWIQSYLFDITRPENPSSYCHIPLWVHKVHQVHSNYLKGVGYNVRGMLDCLNWYLG